MNRIHIVGIVRSLLPAVVLSLAGCASGEEREFIGPADPTTIDRSVARVIVTPTIGTMQSDEAIDFQVFGRNAAGDSIGIEATWTATGGAVTSTGKFSAPVPGSYWIIARSNKQPNKADSAQVLVVGSTNPITQLTVAPKTTSMKVGQSRTFTATAFFSDGTQALVPIFWSASGGAIDGDGAYTPDEAGDQIVVAVVGNGLIDTARVVVTDNAVLTSIDLTPGVDSVEDGASLQYQVSAVWSDGSNSVPAVDFSTDGGSIDSAGLFVAAAPPGDYTVSASDQSGVAVATARVKVRLPRIASVVLSPPSIALTPGASHRFTATARSAEGVILPATFVWQATGGTVSSNGTYTAGSASGTFRVVSGVVGSVPADTSVVIISSPTATLTNLTVSPGSATAAIGDKVQFVATGSWSDGSTAAPPVTWSATGGTITTAGEYTAGSSAGSYVVAARHVPSGRVDSSLVTVTSARITSITVTPATATISAQESRQFTASATWSNGSTAAPTVIWTATGGNVSASGLFTAGTSTGTFRVIARDPAANFGDTSFVTVTSPVATLRQLDVNPGTATLTTGGQQQFYVSGVWSNGATTKPQVFWSTNGGSISSGGRFTAPGTAGTYRVIARHQGGSLADTVAVTVVSPVPTLIAIQLAPGSATLQPGSSLQFGARGVWTSGGSGTPPVSYSATGGTISGSGLYTAGSTPGSFRVIAKQVGGSFADTAAVTIAAAAPVLTGLVVSPNGSTVVTNGGAQFAVAGVWTNGGTGAPPVTWSATGGSISAGGYYSAGPTAGTFRVIAKQVGGTLADTAAVTVTTSAVTLTSLSVAPDPISIQKGLTIEFNASATWSNGSTTTPQVTWSTTGGGTLYSSGRYVAGSAAGTYEVIAQIQGGSAADTAHIDILAPTVTSISLSPGSASVAVGGTQQFAATATWSDGVIRPTAVTYSATGGTVSVNGLYQAGQVAGTFMVIAACGCGKSDSVSVVVTGPGGGGSAQLTSLQLSPTSATLLPGGTFQFSTVATWSDGSTAVPPVSYTATGGSATGSGFYTAPNTLGSYQLIVRHIGGSLADTALISVIASPPPPPSGGWHEPAGMSVTNSRNFDSKAATTSDAAGAQGWDPIEGKFAAFRAVTDAGAPLSASPVLETYYRANHPSGTAPGTAQYSWSRGSRTRRVYHRFALKMDSLFFGNETTTNKLFHVWTNGENRIFYRAVGAAMNNLTFQVALQGTPDPRTRFVANRGPTGSGQILRNRWYVYEIEMVMNSPGQANGVFRVWTNGTLTHEYVDVQIQTASESLFFEQIQWSPTWGGNGANTPYAFSTWLDHSYISIAP